MTEDGKLKIMQDSDRPETAKSSLLKTKELTDPWRTHVKGVNLVLLEIICIGNGVFNSEDVFLTHPTFPDVQFEQNIC